MYIAVLTDCDTIDCVCELTGQNKILHFSKMDAAIRAIRKYRIGLLFVMASSVDMGYMNRQLMKLPFRVRMVVISRDKSYVIMADPRHECIVNSTVV